MVTRRYDCNGRLLGDTEPDMHAFFVHHGDYRHELAALQQRCERAEAHVIRLEVVVREMLERTEYLPVHVIKKFENLLDANPTQGTPDAGEKEGA